MPSGKSRKLGGGNRRKINKRSARGTFIARHIDQVCDDFLKEPEQVHDGKVGPIGTSARQELDEDLPGGGQHFCLPCSKYFINGEALETHKKTKPHKRRLGVLMKHKSDGTRPHSQLDADMAAGLGKPDNGPKLRDRGAAVGMAVAMATD